MSVSPILTTCCTSFATGAECPTYTYSLHCSCASHGFGLFSILQPTHALSSILGSPLSSLSRLSIRDRGILCILHVVLISMQYHRMLSIVPYQPRTICVSHGRERHSFPACCHDESIIKEKEKKTNLITSCSSRTLLPPPQPKLLSTQFSDQLQSLFFLR